MRHTVRTLYGGLTFDSFGDAERAWRQALVEPDDEIWEEGSTKVAKALLRALLVQARRRADAVWGGTLMSAVNSWTRETLVGSTNRGSRRSSHSAVLREQRA